MGLLETTYTILFHFIISTENSPKIVRAVTSGRVTGHYYHSKPNHHNIQEFDIHCLSITGPLEYVLCNFDIPSHLDSRRSLRNKLFPLLALPLNFIFIINE